MKTKIIFIILNTLGAVAVGCFWDVIWVYFVTFALHRSVEVIAWEILFVLCAKYSLIIAGISDVILAMLFIKKGVDHYLVKTLLITEVVVLAIKHFQLVMSASS